MLSSQAARPFKALGCQRFGALQLSMIRDLTKRAEEDNDEDDQQEEEDMNYELSMRSPLQIQHRIPSSSSPSSPSSSSESPIRRLEEVGHIDFPPFYIEGEEPYSAEELSGIDQLEEAVRRATAPRDGTPAVPCPMCRSEIGAVRFA